MAAEPAIDLDLALRVLADRNRRAIMQVIRNEPHQVGAVADELGMSQQAASHHLGVLRRAGLATSTRDANRHLYVINTDALTAVRSYLDDFWPPSRRLWRPTRKLRRRRRLRRQGTHSMTELSQFSHSIDIAAPPRVVFTFLTTEEGMTAWMGQFAELDPRQGGRFAVDISGYPVRGQYLHVEPFSRVVVSWGFAGSDDLPPGASTVEFRLIEIEGGTRVELTHSGWPDNEVPGQAQGWRHCVPRLHVVGSSGRSTIGTDITNTEEHHDRIDEQSDDCHPALPPGLDQR